MMDPAITAQFKSPRFLMDSEKSSQYGSNQPYAQQLKELLQDQSSDSEQVPSFRKVMGQFQNNQLSLNKGVSERQINTANFNLNNQIDLDNSYLDVRHGKNTQQAPSMGARSRNNEVQLPSVKSTSRVLSNRSLIDLMSGVSTNSYFPRDQNSTNINNYPEKMKRLNMQSNPKLNNVKLDMARIAGQISNKTHKFLQNTILSRRDTVQHMPNQHEQLAADYHLNNLNHTQSIQGRNNRPIDVQNSSRQPSMGRLPNLPNQPGSNKIITIIDNNTQQQDEENGQVIQVHSKHYHYNTNNIRIQMVPPPQPNHEKRALGQAKGSASSLLPDHTGDNQIERSKLEFMELYPAQQKRNANYESYLSGTGPLRPSKSNPHHNYIMTTMQPKKILVVNPQGRDSSQGSLNSQKKYFQVY